MFVLMLPPIALKEPAVPCWITAARKTCKYHEHSAAHQGTAGTTSAEARGGSHTFSQMATEFVLLRSSA